MPANGQLYLGINDDEVSDNRGEFIVQITPLRRYDRRPDKDRGTRGTGETRIPSCRFVPFVPFVPSS